MSVIKNIVTLILQIIHRYLINILKTWQKKKIDSVIGVLMNPYAIKPEDSRINIKDFKVFYVLANNSTQLKCYDQLKTFALFSKMLIKMEQN